MEVKLDYICLVFHPLGLTRTTTIAVAMTLESELAVFPYGENGNHCRYSGKNTCCKRYASSLMQNRYTKWIRLTAEPSALVIFT